MATLNYELLPEGLRGGAQHWIEQGVQPGGFLSAVIANNLREAVGRADDNNRTRLAEIVFWFYHEAPGQCWGSTERARAWAARHERAFESE